MIRGFLEHKKRRILIIYLTIPVLLLNGMTSVSLFGINFVTLLCWIFFLILPYLQTKKLFDSSLDKAIDEYYPGDSTIYKTPITASNFGDGMLFLTQHLIVLINYNGESNPIPIQSVINYGADYEGTGSVVTSYHKSLIKGLPGTSTSSEIKRSFFYLEIQSGEQSRLHKFYVYKSDHSEKFFNHLKNNVTTGEYGKDLENAGREQEEKIERENYENKMIKENDDVIMDLVEAPLEDKNDNFLQYKEFAINSSIEQAKEKYPRIYSFSIENEQRLEEYADTVYMKGYKAALTVLESRGFDTNQYPKITVPEEILNQINPQYPDYPSMTEICYKCMRWIRDIEFFGLTEEEAKDITKLLLYTGFENTLINFYGQLSCQFNNHSMSQSIENVLSEKL
jgi:hypothetical protein